MHILITDSGVGGLSICAYAERFLRTSGFQEPFRLTYVNASPENDFGYNSMGSRREKIENFDRFLRIVSSKYEPDMVYIACNTLSVIYGDTEFSKMVSIPVKAIVETGVNLLFHELEKFPQSIAAVFGTDTTIEEGTYSKALIQLGIDGKRIVPQACPSLADTISEDREGLDAKRKIETYVKESIHRGGRKNDPYLAYLACTHYGYRKEYFVRAFRAKNIEITVLNPNEIVVETLFSEIEQNIAKGAEKTDVSVEFVSRYAIPETALETIAFFLADISPRTVEAFQGYTHTPDLF